jgi:hypothetical protein
MQERNAMGSGFLVNAMRKMIRITSSELAATRGMDEYNVVKSRAWQDAIRFTI